MYRRQFLQAALATTAFPAGVTSAIASTDSRLSRRGFTDTEIVIGQSAVRSGPSAALGTEMMTGMLAAFAQVNRAGGVGGRLLKLKSLDDGYEPDRCRENTVALLSEGVFALGGYVGTPTCLAAMPLITDARTPFVGAFTGAQALRTFNPFVFHIRASYQQEADQIAHQLTAFGDVSRVAIMVQADAYGDAVLRAMEKSLDARGVKPVAVARVKRNSNDVQEAVNVIAASKANGVALGSVYSACGALCNGLGYRAGSMQFVSVSFIGTSGLLKTLGPGAKGIGISQVMPFPWAESLMAQNYRRAMKAAGYQEDQISYGSIEGYASGMAIATGLRRCGETPTREAFVAAMESRVDIGDFALNFSRTNHAGSDYVDLTVVGKEGKLIR